jgi:double-stranded uracil-DNA glycosylase
VLVLGSMPGGASLEAREYYAHPRNAFWPIMATLLGTPRLATYRARVAALLRHRIALWDVVAACARPGSLDSAIESSSIVVNDFAAFFAAHERIRAVYCNGTAAATLYRRFVLPELEPRWRDLPLVRLPSTSPAHAARDFAAKLDAWRAVAAAARIAVDGKQE